MKPFADNRQFNQDLYAKYRAIAREPARYWPIAEEEFGFQVILLDAEHLAMRKLIHYLLARSDVRLAFAHGSYLVFLKREVFPLREDVNNFEDYLNSITISSQEIQRLVEIASLKPKNWFQRQRYPSTYYNKSLMEGITLFDLGFIGAGVQRILQAHQDSPDAVQEIVPTVLKIIRNQTL